jgi:hypothetical protein
MKAVRKPEGVAPNLTVAERVLLFCIASGTDWQKAGVSGATVTAVVVKGLIERDRAARLTLSEQGRAALAALLKNGNPPEAAIGQGAARAPPIPDKRTRDRS